MTWRGVLIGCGFFARNHMHGWADAAGARIVAVCDIDPGRAAAFAAEFGADPWTDAAAMLAAVGPDFVDVATTVETHRPLVELALSHGALTVCQKPFAATWADGLAMVEAGERAGRPLLVHENFRWQRAFRRIRAEIDAGSIGDPSFARLSFRHRFDVYANQPYLAEVEDFGLMDMGLHLLDLARFLMGDVATVSCLTQRLNPAIRGEDAFTALLGHTKGGVTSIDCSFYAQTTPDPFPETLARIDGPEGTIELDLGCRIRVHGREGVREIDGDPEVPSWGERPWHFVQDSVAAFEAHVVDVLDGAAEPQPSGRHNLETLAMTLACYRSAARRETVDLAAFIAGGCRR
ncbi:MAG TPA: Gfo/Idh/MocA family oxidoreductase [Amaricoccus sp.]|nr:Gfo/Idh/MocA family oxidoreductase [Amaricoccus sp.]